MKYRIVTAFSEDRGRLSVFFDQREGGEDREPSPVFPVFASFALCFLEDRRGLSEGDEDREPSPVFALKTENRPLSFPVFASPAFRITATLIVLALPHGA